MRKRQVNHLADTIFWYMLYFLPVLGFLIYLIAEPAGGTTLVTFSDFLSGIGFNFVADNPLISTLSDIFGANGVLPIFQNNDVFIIFAWYFGIYFCHIAVDLLLCLPRICHKWLNRLGD